MTQHIFGLRIAKNLQNEYGFFFYCFKKLIAIYAVLRNPFQILNRFSQ